jgi:hypothetical protein
VKQQLATILRNDQRLLAGVSFFVACYLWLLYMVLTRNPTGIALSAALLAINFLALRWTNLRQPIAAQAAARRYPGARRYIIRPLIFLSMFLSLTPSSFAQGNGDPVIICEYCNADGTSGTPPGQPPSGTPTGTTGYATGTNAAGQTVQFPVGTFPSNQVSGLSPIDPANAAKIGVPVGWTIAGQDAQGNPVLQRPDGTYAIIYTSHPQITGNGDPSQSATPPPVSPPSGAGLPSAQIQKLMDLVRELVPYMRRQIERPLLEKFTFIAMILSSIILLFSFIRVIRENDGASTELYYWFGRAIICMAIFAIAPSVISTLYKIGRTLTIPIEPMIEEKRTAFNDQYYAFVQGHFIIKDEQNVFVQPAYIEPGEFGWVGILTDHESGDGKVNGLKAIESATDMTSWSMPKLFFGLNVARGILQSGEIFLLILSGFIMIGLRLAVPFMVAVAVDKKLAERISYPFIWGTVVFTLIFPIVRDTLIFIAYTIGSFGLSLYDGSAPYSIDARTAQIIKNNAYDPTLIIIITLVIILINGMMLWLSPYLAYRIATGQIFEAVSSTASGWMAAIVGSAIEFTGLKAGASLQRQAENTQTQGGYQAEMTRARGSLDAANLGANARQISGHANIEGNRTATLSAIAGGAQTARGMAQSSANFTVAATRAQVADTNRQMWYRANQANAQTSFSQGSESIRIAGDASSSHIQNKGSALGGVPYAGPAIGSVFSDVGITRRNRANNLANNTFATNTIHNETATANKVQESQFTYRGDMETATQAQLDGNISAINAGAGTAAGGANRGAAIAASGVDKAYSLEVQANQVQFGSTTTAAGQIKDANLEASHLRELSTIISGVARDMDRRIEEGMRQRY